MGGQLRWRTLRIYPNTTQETALNNWLRIQSTLWEVWSAERAIGITHGQQRKGLKALSQQAEYCDLPRPLIHSTHWALRKSLSQGKANDDHERKALEFDSNLWSVEGKRLTLTPLGEMRLRGNVPAEPIKLTLTKQDGQWYAHIGTYKAAVAVSLDPARAVGLDPGTSTWLTSHEGETWEQHPYAATLTYRLLREMRAQEKRTRGGKRYRDGQQRISRTRKRLRQAQYQRAHELARDIATRYDYIAIEAVNRGALKPLSGIYSPRIDLANWSLLVAVVENEANLRGKRVVKVPPYFTTRDCSQCGYRGESLDNSTRVFACAECGYETSRDVNSAANILKLGRQRMGI